MVTQLYLQDKNAGDLEACKHAADLFVAALNRNCRDPIPIPPELARQIHACYPRIDCGWLLTGEPSATAR